MLNFSANFNLPAKRVSIHYQEPSGMAKTKTISLADFLDVLSKDSVNLSYIAIPKAPENFLFGAMERSSTPDSLGGKFTFLVPAHTNSITYAGTSYTIAFPDLVFQISVLKNEVLDYYVWAKKADSDLLYLLPFGNVYSDGRICKGSNHYTMKELFDYGAVVLGFFAAPFNDDLFSAAKTGMSLRAVFQKLSREWDFNLCVPYKTLDDIRKGEGC